MILVILLKTENEDLKIFSDLNKMTERKIIITDDDKQEDKFTHSTCECNVCEGMKTGSKEWKEFSPKNNLQRRMKDVVDRIEAREKAKVTRPKKKMKMTN